MESSILKQIARFLQEQKKQKRWLVVFLCMAVIVGFGTVTALKMRGQAMTHKEKVVICQLEVHQHTDECYDEKKENLICGYADYVVHVHNDDCYDWNGNLTCQLPEVEKHEHSEECYTEEKTLICGLEESAGHQHGAECYTRQQGALVCQVPEHTHAAECYDETGAVICGLEEHVHEDTCYEWNDVLTCQLAEGADGHTHTDACYEVKNVLTCGKLELHTHTDECYEKINEEEELSETNRRLICTIPVLEEHVHTEEAGCLETVEVTANGEMVEEGTTEETAENETEDEIFTTDLDGEETEGEETETEQKAYDKIKTYEGDGYVVTVSYNEDANIPEEAELIAEQITEEKDAERYAEHEAQVREMVEDEENSKNALFKIGFYIEEDGEKKEVEPETPVAVTIQFLDEDGGLEGLPITVIHFAEEGNEVLDGSDIEDGSTTFEMESFSYLWVEIGSKARNADEADTEKVSVHISKDAKYEDDVFSATFHIDGEIGVSEEIAKEIENGSSGEGNGETSPEGGTTEEESPSEEGAEAGNTPEGEAEAGEESPSEEGAEEGNPSEERTEEENAVGEGAEENSSEESGEAADNGKLKFEVKPVDENADGYKAVLEHVEQSGEMDEMLRLQTVSYSLTYDGDEIDISGCKISAEITTASALNEQALASVPEAVKQVLGEEKATEIGENKIAEKTGIVVKAVQVKDTEVEVVGETGVNEREVAEPISDTITAKSDGVGMFALASASPTFTVQYYAYAQILADGSDEAAKNAEKITIIDTSKREGMNGPQLPNNDTIGNATVGNGLKNMYVQPYKENGTAKVYTHSGKNGNGEDATVTWPVYEPVYKNKDTTESLTKLYTPQAYQFVEVQTNGLKNVDKFAKAGLNYDLYEVWVLQDSANKADKVDALEKDGWTIYRRVKEKDDSEYWTLYDSATKEYKGKIANIEFVNNESGASSEKGKILIKSDTIVRVVGQSNTGNKSYPTRFFDYDITNGKRVTDTNYKTNRQGINSVSNYTNNVSPLYGFGNDWGNRTGLANEKIVKKPGRFINRAVAKDDDKKTSKDTIREKCAYDLVQSELSESGYPQIKANAPEIFNPDKTETGKTVIDGRNLMFGRDGDTYTLEKVSGSDECAKELNLFQKGAMAWGTKSDQIWTNQFWPMDNADSFGTGNHDKKSGTYKQSKEESGFDVADDFQEHNYFFGMNFEVGFELTDDYVGPLNYYFFGDDDMWVFLEYPDGSTKLICDIGGVHQAAGEYVNLWDYIDKPNDDTPKNQVKTSYKLKFFYTERGATGSTCWMQFTLPSVNAVPLKNYTGGAKTTLTVQKKIDGEVPEALKDIAFDFEITFSGSSANVDTNDYPCEIRDVNGNIVEDARKDIKSGEKFKLKHGWTIEVSDLPDGTTYQIKEVDGDGYEPGVDQAGKDQGVVVENEVVEGHIDWKRDDAFGFINNPVKYELPKTGGYGPIIYTMAGVLAILSGAGFMYRKKVRERRV